MRFDRFRASLTTVFRLAPRAPANSTTRRRRSHPGRTLKLLHFSGECRHASLRAAGFDVVVHGLAERRPETYGSGASQVIRSRMNSVRPCSTPSSSLHSIKPRYPPYSGIVRFHVHCTIRSREVFRCQRFQNIPQDICPDDVSGTRSVWIDARRIVTRSQFRDPDTGPERRPVEGVNTFRQDTCVFGSTFRA